jgi:hypothetical protein
MYTTTTSRPSSHRAPPLVHDLTLVAHCTCAHRAQISFCHSERAHCMLSRSSLFALFALFALRSSIFALFALRSSLFALRSSFLALFALRSSLWCFTLSGQCVHRVFLTQGCFIIVPLFLNSPPSGSKRSPRLRRPLPGLPGSKLLRMTLRPARLHSASFG